MGSGMVRKVNGGNKDEVHKVQQFYVVRKETRPSMVQVEDVLGMQAHVQRDAVRLQVQMQRFHCSFLQKLETIVLSLLVHKEAQRDVMLQHKPRLS